MSEVFVLILTHAMSVDHEGRVGAALFAWDAWRAVVASPNRPHVHGALLFTVRVAYRCACMRTESLL